MSTLAAESKSIHQMQIPISLPVNGPLRVDAKTSLSYIESFDQSTLIAYISCFIKNFIGASGSSVAIDNKIEQAMDLVKSHLMFAVREEVEVLKEKISELMDRINQLEYENTILKANASHETLETLAQIQSKSSQLLGGNPNSSNNNNTC